MTDHNLDRTCSLGLTAICVLLASAFSTSATAQTLSTIHGGWRITIDEAPAPEFVAQTLEELNALYEPQVVWDPPSEPNWCCIGAGNYGGTVESVVDPETIPFVRPPDDVDPFAIGIGLAGCERVACATGVYFLYDGDSPIELANYIARVIETSDSLSLGVYETPLHELTPILGWHFDANELATRFPVFVGQSPVFDSSTSTPFVFDVWVVTLSAVPEPATITLCICAIATLLIRARKA